MFTKSAFKSSSVKEKRLSNSNSDEKEMSPKKSIVRMVDGRKSVDTRINIPRWGKTGKGRENATTNEPSDPNDLANYKDLKMQAIVGTKEHEGKIFHLVKCDGKDELQFVPAIVTTLVCPHLALGFYRLRLNHIDKDIEVPRFD